VPSDLVALHEAKPISVHAAATGQDAAISPEPWMRLRVPALGAEMRATLNRAQRYTLAAQRALEHGDGYLHIRWEEYVNFRRWFPESSDKPWTKEHRCMALLLMAAMQSRRY